MIFLILLLFPALCFGMPDIAPAADTGIKQIQKIDTKEVDDYVSANSSVSCPHISTQDYKGVRYDQYDCTDGHKIVLKTQLQ